MKNTLNYIWSLWSKSDRIIAVVSTICIVLLVCIFCTSCNAQPSSVDDIPVMEYYDASGEDFEDNLIPIYADGIVDFIYCTQDNEYIIEYSDDDYFDIDNLPQQNNCASAESTYVCIYCEPQDFYTYLDWYSKLTNQDRMFYESNPVYYIKEIYLDEEDTGYWFYKLVKK